MIRNLFVIRGCFFQPRNSKSHCINLTMTSLFSSKSDGIFNNKQNLVLDSREDKEIEISSASVDLEDTKCSSADDIEAAKDYYDRYYKMFNTLPHPSDESNIQNKYYDDYANLFSNNEVGSMKCVKDAYLTHVNEKGEINMVDVGSKSDTVRIAIARSTVKLGKKAFELVKQNQVEKGDVISTAKIAGIMAAKNTSNMIPLCHPLALSKVAVTMEFLDEEDSLHITSEVRTSGKTGVEMEALVSVSVASLTVYDMCKAVTKDITISNVQLMHKSGGKSGDYWRE